MLAKVHSSAVAGLDAVLITVEVDVSSQGLPSFTIVGLPDKAVEEAKERVRTALKNSGFDFPDHRITVNLAPADLPKEGPSYDLPIALGILVASQQIKADLKGSMFIGELSLDGSLSHVNGVLPQIMLAKERKYKNVFLPEVNSKEASIIKGITVYAVEDLKVLFKHFSEDETNKLHPVQKTNIIKIFKKDEYFEFDMKDIKGQEHAKRALEIAAAGGHNMFMKGPPGAGKTLLARTLPSILPNLTFDEALEVTKIYSISGFLANDYIIRKRPFRSPHHTTSHIGLIGGGANPKPGDISLAHRGVLFLDEFPEFPRHVLEALRQPMEDGYITVSRAHGRVTYPAKFMLVAAANPCPCGYLGDAKHNCSCTPSQIIRYQKKVSGPILDRIDIHLDVPAVEVEKLTAITVNTNIESSKQIRKRVQSARNRQEKRFKKTRLANRRAGIVSNTEMTEKQIKEFCQLSTECLNLLRLAVSKMNLSARSYNRVIKIAQTITDLEGSVKINQSHIAEALQYRPKQQVF